MEPRPATDLLPWEPCRGSPRPAAYAGSLIATVDAEMRDQIARFQAKWQLGFIPPEQVPAAATAMRQAGVDGTSLAVLAGLIDPSRSEVEPLVCRFLVEVGAPSITDAEACWLLARAGVEAIAAGTVAPRKGAAQIGFLCRKLGMPELLRALASLSVDDSPDDSRLDDRIRATAREVLAALQRPPGGAT